MIAGKTNSRGSATIPIALAELIFVISPITQVKKYELIPIPDTNMYPKYINPTIQTYGLFFNTENTSESFTSSCSEASTTCTVSFTKKNLIIPINPAGSAINNIIVLQPCGEVAIFAIIIGKATLITIEASMITIPPKEASLTL